MKADARKATIISFCSLPLWGLSLSLLATHPLTTTLQKTEMRQVWVEGDWPRPMYCPTAFLLFTCSSLWLAHSSFVLGDPPSLFPWIKGLFLDFVSWCPDLTLFTPLLPFFSVSPFVIGLQACRMGLSFTGTWSTWSLLPGKWSVSLSSSLSSPSDDTRAAQNTYQCYSLPFPLEFNQHSQTSSSGCCSSGGFGIIHFAFLNIVNNCNMLVCMQEGVNYQTF